MPLATLLVLAIFFLIVGILQKSPAMIIGSIVGILLIIGVVIWARFKRR
jgi:hypothetical protein